jgi:hypothetical protein
MCMRERTLRPMACRAALLLAGLSLLAGCATTTAPWWCTGPGGTPSMVAGCSNIPRKPTQAEVNAKAEQQAKKAAEQAKVAEEQRQIAEVQQAFGPEGQAPDLGPLPAPKVEGTPFDEAVPPLPPEPTVRVVVLSHDAPLAKGRDVALLVGTYDRDRIEARTGMAVKIVYVAESSRPLARASEVHYRKNYLTAAQSVAQAMSAQQWIAPMTPDEQSQQDADLVIHIGKDYR